MAERRSQPLCAVIFTAIPVEYKAVLAHLKDVQEETHPQGTIYSRGTFSSAAQSWDMVLVEIGTGNTVPALEGERAVSRFQPDVILFVGVAGGLKDVQVGDVVAATKVYGYESGRVEQGAFRVRPEVARSTYRLEQRARAEARRTDWLQQIIIASGGRGRSPGIHVWDSTTGQRVAAYDGHSHLLPTVTNLAWSPSGEYLASTCINFGVDNAVHIWKALSGRRI